MSQRFSAAQPHGHSITTNAKPLDSHDIVIPRFAMNTNNLNMGCHGYITDIVDSSTLYRFRRSRSIDFSEFRTVQ